MNWDAIGAVGEVFGAIAVIATLVYLSIQVKQGINSVQGATELDASRQWADLHARIGHSPELRKTWDKAAAEEELTPDEHSAYLWLVAEMFFLFEGYFRQYQRGLITEASWDPMITTLAGMLKNKIVANWWNTEVAPVSGEFRSYINKVRAEKANFELADTRKMHEDIKKESAV